MRRTFQSLGAHKELLDLLTAMSDWEALDVIRRLRSGDDVQSVLDRIKEGRLLLQLAVMPEVRRRRRSL